MAPTYEFLATAYKFLSKVATPVELPERENIFL